MNRIRFFRDGLKQALEPRSPLRSAARSPRLSTQRSAVLAGLLFATHVAAAAPDRTHPPALGPLAPFQVMAPVEWQLSNGLRVVFVERHRAPLVDAVLMLAGGDVYDAPNAPGVAHYTAAMLTEGAQDRDAIAFADAVGALGASVNSGSGPRTASVSMHCTSARVDSAFALMADAVRAPRFDGDAWARVQRTLLGDFLRAADDPNDLADLAARRSAWGDAQRFGLPPAGFR